MKKRIGFYIGWDALIICMLAAYYVTELRIRQYRLDNFSISPLVIVMPILLIIIGVVFALLVWISSPYQFTRKQAVLEFILIGFPALYLATLKEMFFVVYFIIGVNLPLYEPISWLINTPTPSIIGGLIFGYELFMLINRLKKCKRFSCEGNVRK